MKIINIAIDGPAGAGKSTISEILAQRLGLSHVDTGAIYRTIGLFAFQKGLELQDAPKVAEFLGDIEIKLDFSDGDQRMLLNGKDVTRDIRRHEISAYASAVSAVPEVRAFLLDLQRNIAKETSVVMDGRDIGTIVLPGADVKVFLTATAEDRAGRRYRELLDNGESADYHQILQDVIARDKKDSTRAIAPLKAAADAVVVDTTGFELEKSAQTLEEIIRRRLDHVL